MTHKPTTFNRRDEAQSNAYKASLYYWADKNHYTEEELLNPMIVPRNIAEKILESRRELARING